MTVFHKVVTTLWLFFFVIKTAPSPIKPFIRPADIEQATGSFADKFVYVDKTNHFSELFNIDGFGQTYFFVRPRRFGKSVFLQTLRRIFQGERKIFNHTYIYQSDYNWVPYPVLYLDFSDTKEKNCDKVMISNGTRLVKEMQLQLEDFIEIHKLPYNLNKSNDVVSEFVNILRKVRKQNGNSTTVLVDEYDLPVLSNMKDCLAAAMVNKGHLEDLFQRLKTKAGLIKFAFVTGVSKRVFRMMRSGHDLTDITNDPRFHDIAGNSDTDLNTVYADHIAEIAKRRNESNVTGILRDWYDGYQFADGIDSRLYSPLSVHGYFRTGGVAQAYYGEQGHFEFIFDQMVKRPREFSNLNLNAPVRSDLMGGKSLDDTQPEVLLHDAGDLTIQMVKNGQYFLSFPNKEMELTFHKNCADAAWRAKHGTRPEVCIIGDSLKKQEPDVHTFMSAVNTALMKMKIRPKYEQWYQHETRNFMDQAKILYTDVETAIKTENFGDRKIDITGYDEH